MPPSENGTGPGEGDEIARGGDDPVMEEVERMRQLGINFEDQIEQHVEDLQLSLQSVMMAEFRRHFAAQYAGVLQATVLSIKNVDTSESSEGTAPSVRLVVNSTHAQTPPATLDQDMLTFGPEKVHVFPMEQPSGTIQISAVDDGGGDAVVLADCEATVAKIAAAGGPAEEWYTLTQGEARAWLVLIKFEYVPSESFNVCDTQRFKLKIDQNLGDGLTQMKACAAAAQVQVNDQKQSIETLIESNRALGVETEETLQANKQAIQGVQIVRQDYTRQLAAQVVNIADQKDATALTQTDMLSLDVLSASFEPTTAARADGLGYFVSVSLGDKRGVTATALSQTAPTWNTNITLPIPTDVSDNTNNTLPLCIQLRANTPSGDPSRIVACQGYEPAIWMPITDDKVVIKANMYSALKSNDGSDTISYTASPDVDSPPVCSLMIELGVMKGSADLLFDQLLWEQRHVIEVLVGNVRAQLTDKARELTQALKAERYNHEQMIQATFDLCDLLDPHTTIAALDKMKELVNKFEISQLSALAHVGGVRTGCLDAIQKFKTAMETMLAPMDKLVFEATLPDWPSPPDPVPDSYTHDLELKGTEDTPGARQEPLGNRQVSFNTLRRELNEEARDDDTADNTTPAGSSVDQLLSEQLTSWGARMCEFDHLIRRSTQCSKDAHEICDSLHQELSPQQGRLHLHLATIQNLPVVDMSCTKLATVVVLVSIQNKTYKADPVLLDETVMVNTHLVVDVLDLLSTEISIRVCVSDPTGKAGDQLMLVGSTRVPLVNAVAGQSLDSELPLNQAKRSYATYGTISTSVMFADAMEVGDAPTKYRRSEYSRRARLLLDNYNNKVTVLEDHLKSIRTDQAAVSARATELVQEKDSLLQQHEALLATIADLESQLPVS